MAITPNPHNTTGFLGWIDDRFPLTKLWKDHVGEYYAPKNFNFWYYFGSLALLVLVNQLLTGIFLTMHYTPSAEEAFASVAESRATHVKSIASLVRLPANGIRSFWARLSEVRVAPPSRILTTFGTSALSR